jgi:sec-independent protein translocase protein TatA
MLPKIGPVELVLILVIVTMLFGVGKLPELFGAVGKGVREFRKASEEPVTPTTPTTTTTPVTDQTPKDPTTPVV